MASARATIDVCGIPIANFRDAAEAIEAIEERAFRGDGRLPLQVSFVNAHVVNVAMRTPPFMSVLDSGGMNLADGVGIWLGGRILRGVDLVNLNGTDFGIEVLKRGASAGRGFFFLGASDGIAELAKEKLERRIPGLRVLGCHDGYLDEASSGEAIRQIVESGADALFVCMGVPSQELWIRRHLHELGCVKLALGLGAFFDFYAERVPRSPLWMRELRIEWVYRLLKEPRRLWKRYILGNAAFLMHIMASKLGLNAKGR